MSILDNKVRAVGLRPENNIARLLAMGHVIIPPVPSDAMIEAMARAMDKEIAGENFHDIPTRAMARAAYAALNEYSPARKEI